MVEVDHQVGAHLGLDSGGRKEMASGLVDTTVDK